MFPAGKGIGKVTIATIALSVSVLLLSALTTQAWVLCSDAWTRIVTTYYILSDDNFYFYIQRYLTYN